MPPEPDDLDEEILDDEDLVEEPEDEEDEGPEPEEEEPLTAEDEDEEPEPAPRPARKPFKQRVEEVAARLVEDRLREERSRPAPASQETQAQRNARLAEMEPWERTEYVVNERLSRLEYEGQDRLDKIDFQGLLRDRPSAAKLAPEVERRLAAMRGNGFNASREVILKQILGERAWDNAGRATGRAARTAAANRERQTTRPGAARSDAVSTDTRRGDSAQARARRLENQNI